MNIKSSDKFAVTGVLAAIGASLCCIIPVLALLAGTSGVVSTFSRLEPLRPWLMGITVLVLGLAWYQKLKKRSDNTTCACENNTKKASFLQSGKFLGAITLFAMLMTAFPYYSHVFYPTNKKEIVVMESDNIISKEFSIKGMTCQGCAAHVESAVNKLPGIVDVQASYEDANAKVQYDKSKVSTDEIESAINSTGYEVLKNK